MADTSDSKNVLRVGILSPIHNLDPRQTRDFTNAMVQWQVFETPYAPPFADDPPAPVIFAEPLRKDDAHGRAWSAPVRRGIRFSDGALMTVQHVADSLRYAKSITEQADFSVRGDRIVFQLRRDNARFDVSLTHTDCAVQLRKAGRLIGTGPYMVAPDGTAERFRLVRNPHYRQPAAIEEIFFVTYPPEADGHPTQLVRALRDGKVDFSRALSRGDLSDLRGVRKWFEPGTSTAILSFNTERTILRSSVVRKALALSLSRSRLTRVCYTNPLAFTASGLLPPMMGRWRDGLRHDLEAAKELLGRPGVTAPRSLNLLVIWGPRPYLPEPRKVAAMIAKQLEDLDVEVKVHPTRDKTDYHTKVARGHYDLVLAGWIADTPDPADYLETTLSSEAIPRVGESMAFKANLSRWKSTEMDAQLQRYRADPSLDNRGRILQLLNREVPLMPLMYGPMTVAHSWRVKNVQLSPLGLPFFGTMELR